MKLKSFLRKTGKITLSAALAFCALTVLCTFYYNFADYAECADGATDFCRKPNAFYCGAVEGFVCGRTNNEGYLNLYDYTPGMEINILVFGSSQMEANQVQTKYSCAAQLGRLMPDKTVYNIGMSSHRFFACADNLAAAANKYKPTDYMILETSEIDFSLSDTEKYLSENQPDLYNNIKSNILGHKNNGIRLANSQFHSFWDISGTKKVINSSKALLSKIKNGKPLFTSKTENTAVQEEKAAPMSDAAMIEEVIAKISGDVSPCGAKLIILYMPNASVMSDGSMEVFTSENIDLFREICEKYDITLVDMSECFYNEYKTNRHVPYGFTNTPVCSGHLNKYGHAMIAETLYNTIEEMK